MALAGEMETVIRSAMDRPRRIAVVAWMQTLALVFVSLVGSSCHGAECRSYGSEGVAALGIEEADLDIDSEFRTKVYGHNLYAMSANAPGDGSPDRVLVTDHEGSPGFSLLPHGASGFFEPTDLDEVVWVLNAYQLSPTEPARGDFDGDGAADLAFTYEDPAAGSGDRGVALLLDSALPAAGQAVPTAILDIGRSDVWGLRAIEDPDGDGVAELALEVSDEFNQISYAWCWGPIRDNADIGDCDPVEAPYSVTSSSIHPPRASGDVDGDGYVDVLAGSSAGLLVVSGGTSHTFDDSRIMTTINLDGGSGDDVYLLEPGGDLDGDGGADLVVSMPNQPALGNPDADPYFGWSEYARGRGNVYVFTGIKPGSLTRDDAALRVQGAPTAAGFGRDVRLADMDGSGFADLVVSFNGLDDVVSYFGPRTGGAFDGAFVFRDPPVGGCTSLTLADASGGAFTRDDRLDLGEFIDVLDNDGDGILDLLVVGNNHAYEFSGAKLLGL